MMTDEEKLELQNISKGIVTDTKKQLEGELDKILAGKYATVADMNKVMALLNKDGAGNVKKESVPFNLWIRDVANGKIVKKALDEGTDAEGGYLVPPEYSTKIFQIQQKFTALSNLATQMTVGSDQFKGVSLLNDVSVGWVDEGATIPETSPSFAQNMIYIKKLAVTVRISNELLQDTKANLTSFLTALVARASVKELDNQIINGNGAPFYGVLFNANVPVVVSSAALADVLNYDDIVDVETAVNSDYIYNPAFVLHRTIAGILKKKKDSTGRPLGILDPKTKTIDELKYIVSERAPHDTSASKPILIYGDWANIIVAKKKALTLQILKEKYSDTDQTGLKFVGRYGISLATPETFVVLQTAAS